MALTGGAIGQGLQINPDHELVDPEMVTPTFCNVCSVPLKTDHEFGGNKKQDIKVDDFMPTDLYHVHIFTELNIFLYKRFTTIISNDPCTSLHMHGYRC